MQNISQSQKIELENDQIKIFELVEKKINENLIINKKSLVEIYDDIEENNKLNQKLLNDIKEINEKPYSLMTDMEKTISEAQKELVAFNNFDKKIENAYLRAEQVERKYDQILESTNLIIGINKVLNKKIEEIGIEVKKIDEIKSDIKEIKEKLNLKENKEIKEENNGTFFTKLFKKIF